MNMVDSLTSFRFITAFVVFLFHCNIHLNWKVNVKVIDNFFANGATFMTGFFVLSGFIMTHVYGNTDFTKRRNIFAFYIKRFARIYPVYIFATGVFFIVFHHFKCHEFIRIMLNDIFLIQGYFPSMFELGLNGGTWSLSVEALLYFLFPFLMIILNNNGKTALVIGILGSLLISVNVKCNLGGAIDTIYSNPIFRIPDFLIGIGCYLLLSKKYFNRGVSYISFFSLLLCCTLLGHPKYQYVGGGIYNYTALWDFDIYCLLFKE